MMFDWDKIKQEDLLFLIRNTANKRMIQETIVEKRKFVTW